MKTIRHFFVVVASAIAQMIASGAPNDIKISQQNSAGTAWVDTIFSTGANKYIGTDANGIVSLQAGSGGGGSPGGSNGQVQYNNSGSFGGFSLGTNVQTALGVNVGSAGAFVIFGGALGTPSSGTGTNITNIPAANVLSGALASGMTATTQTVGDNSTKIATTAYVDASVADDIEIKNPVVAATNTALLFSPSYSNGSSGVGATLTGSVGVLIVDGYTPVLNDRILVKNEASTLTQGVYTLTRVGTVVIGYILTRATDFNQAANILYGDTVGVLQGTVNANQQFTMNNQNTITVGTTAITFAQTSGGSQLIAGTGIAINANTISVASPTATASGTLTSGNITIGGGTQVVSTTNISVSGGNNISNVGTMNVTTVNATTLTSSSATTNGQIPIWNVTNGNFSIATITQGANVTITNAAGGITIAGNYNGNVTSAAALTANALVLGNGTTTEGAMASLGSSGQILRSAGAGTPPIWSTPTYPNTATTNKILVGDGTNIVLSTPTFPNASATTRKIIVSDGTNWVASTETYAVPGTSGNILVSDGTNWTSIPSLLQTEVTLTDGATVTQTMVANQPDQNAKVTLAGNRTLAFSGLAAGMRGNLRVIQDGTGSRTLTLPANSKVIAGGAGAVTLTTTASAVDILSWYSPDGTLIEWTIGKNFN